jgi:hypothetical protein
VCKGKGSVCGSFIELGVYGLFIELGEDMGEVCVCGVAGSVSLLRPCRKV